MKNLFIALCVLLSGCGAGADASYLPWSTGIPVVTTYTITASAGANGTITPSGVRTVNSGDNQSFTMACDPAYAINSVTVDGSSALASSPYAFLNVTANHTISFTCAIPALGTIAAVQAAWAATPYIVGNTVQYFCDCTGTDQTCSASGVTQGSDSNDGSLAHPKQTMTAAVAYLNGGRDRTAALCQGGSFSPPASPNANFTYRVGRSDCTVGTICQELREYPVGGTNPKPIIWNAGADNLQHYLFYVNSGGYGGIRFLNLTTTVADSQANYLNWGFDIWASQHDWTIGNVTIKNFDMGVVNNGSSAGMSRNVVVTGNEFDNVRYFVISGSGGITNMQANYNAIIDSGNDTLFDHSIYIGNESPSTNIEIIGNYSTGFYANQVTHNTQCLGAMISFGGEQSNVTIKGNTIVQLSSNQVSGGCYGIAGGNHGYNVGGKLNNVVIEDNVIVNPGGLGIIVDTCQDCVIKNNVLYNDTNTTATPYRGIRVANSLARDNAGVLAAGPCTPDSPATGVTCADQVSSRVSVLNNTIYTTASQLGGMMGVYFGAEGTGYVSANNTVTYLSSSGSAGVNCFDYELATSAYTAINNNHCYSVASHNWEKNHGATLVAWRTYSGFDSASFETNANWSAPSIPTWSNSSDGAHLWSTYFKPVSAGIGNNLIGTGNHTYAPILDILGNTFSNPPDIGAYQH